MTPLELALFEGRVNKKWRCEKCDAGSMVGPYPPDPTEENVENVRWLCPRCAHHVQLIETMRGEDGQPSSFYTNGLGETAVDTSGHQGGAEEGKKSDK